MGIIYCEKDRTFTLQTKNTTYQMQVDRYGFLLHLYYGKKTDGCMDYLLTYYDRGFSGNPYDAGEDRTYSMDTLPQEFPCYGNGDFRSTAFAVENADGSMSCDLRYKSHKIFDGKYNLQGLPAVYASEEEAQTLEILMEDPVTGVKVVLLYGVLPAQDIITRSVCVKNESSGKIYLNKIESASLDFLYGDYELLTFYGRHAMERNVQRVPVVHGTQKIGSVRGTSSHQYNPMMILAEKETTEDAGTCYGMSFVYSGGFKAEVEKDQFGQTRIQMGLQEEQFSYPYNPGLCSMDSHHRNDLHSLPLFLLLHLSVILSFLRSLKAPHFLFLVNQKYNICMRKNTTKEPKSVKKMKNAVGLIEKKCYSTY